MKTLFLSLVSFLLISSGSFAQKSHDSDVILGKWYSEDKDAKFEIFKENNMYYAKIFWLQDPIDENTKKPRTDVENPVESKRNQPLVGLVFMKDLVFKGDKLWEDGKIYDPKNGSTYDSYIKLEDENTLNVRGYVGFSFIGRTTVWKRVLD